MGRHSSSKSNSGIAKELVYGIIAVIVAIALGIAWFVLRGATADEHANEKRCPAGEITVPYALIGSTISSTKLQEEYLATNPVIQDFCVTGFEGTSAEKAALVYTSMNDETTKTTLNRSNKSATSPDWPIVDLKDIGVAVPTQRAGEAQFNSWTQMTGVALINEQPLAASIAHSAMTNKPDQTIPRQRAIDERQPFVTVSSEVPADYTFVYPEQPSGLHHPTRIFAVNTSDSVTEEQSRAAVSFIEFAKDKVTKLDGPALQSMETALAAAPLPAEAVKLKPGTGQTQPQMDTLILLDTSETMGLHFAGVSNELSTRATQLGELGHHVGVWNYSSPLSAGVTRGWRNNVSLDDASAGTNAATAITRFGTGGNKQTHEALVAALSYAERVAFENNKPVKVVLVTTGTTDAGSQGPLTEALKNVDAGRVNLQVVHVGDAPYDKELEDWATQHGGSFAATKDVKEREAALNNAFGL